MKSVNMFRKIAGIGAGMGLALGLVACSGASENPEITTVQASDGGGNVTSDGGGAEVEAEPEKQIPAVIAAIEPPDKADYPELGGQSRAAANDHAKYFIDTMLYGYATGDSKPFAETFDPLECDICVTIQDRINKNKTESIFFDNYPKLKPLAVEFMGFGEDATAIVFYTFEISAHQRFENGSEVSEIPARLHGATVYMNDYGDGWVIKNVEFSDEEI